MSSTDADTGGKIFWRVAGDPGFSEARSQAFTVVNDGQSRSYWFNFSGDSDWTDTITQLRLDPVANGHGGEVAIDFIRLLAVILPGDVNLDGTVDGLDVGPFVNMLVNDLFQQEADMNADGSVNGLDVALFVAAVLDGGGTDAIAESAIPEPSALFLLAEAGFGLLVWRRRRRMTPRRRGRTPTIRSTTSSVRSPAPPGSP